VTDVLKTGAGVGVKEWLTVHGDHVKSEAVEKRGNEEQNKEARRNGQECC
jgi:hypothetical protein